MKLYNELNNDDIDKIILLKMILGLGHMDSYYNEWIKYKMNTYKDFISYLDVDNKKRYEKFDKLSRNDMIAEIVLYTKLHFNNIKQYPL